MKRKIAKKWVEALRSGQYVQGKESLCQQDGASKETFCCLGVLCDLYAREVNDGSGFLDDVAPASGNYLFRIGMTGSVDETILPNEVMSWSGMQSDNGESGEGDCLAQRNDKGQTFEEIANKIENSVREL